MDKKNTMLLTVIAVATLLVAVVGATFAYFSLTTTGNATTTVNAKTSKIPTITLSTDHDKLYLNVNATEMAETSVKKEYYAVSDVSKRNATELTNHNILTITTDQGEDTTKYHCSGTIEVSVSGSMVEADVKPGDVTIVLTNLGGEEGTMTIDLVGIKAKSNTDSHDISIDLIGNTNASVQAYVMLKNSNDNQNYLADKELNVTITPKNIACPVQQ